MMFRKLYWVTEEVDPTGKSKVSGVYTSIPDLIRYGIHSSRTDRLRLSLAKLDSPNGPLGCWSAPEFSGLEITLQEYIRTDEFSAEQCDALVAELHRPARVAV